MTGGIKLEESDEVNDADDQENHEAAREKPMWINKLVDGSGFKLDDRPKLSPRRSTRTRITNKRYASNCVALMSNLS